jgi:YVTN family beta-propeller protein
MMSLRFVFPRAAAVVLTLIVASSCSGSGPDDPGTPSAVVAASGQNQTGQVGQTLAAPLVVRVVTDKNQPVANQPVEFVVIAGGGMVTARFDTTDQSGQAQTQWTLGTSVAGSQQVVVTAFSAETNGPLVPATFNAIPVAGAPAQLTGFGGAGPHVANEPLADSLGVILQDLYGNPIPNVDVTWTVLSGGGQVSPATARTNAQGTAKARLTLGPGRTQSARAAVGGLTAMFSFQAKERPSGTRVNLPGRPYALAINSAGIVYAPRLDAASAARFELPSRNITAHVSVGTTPTDVSFDAVGAKAFVSNQGGSVSVIDVATNTVSLTIPVRDRAFVSRTSPNGERLYIGSAIGKVYAYELATGQFVDSVTVGDVPQHLTFSPDGTRLYVSMRDVGRVVEVNLATHAIARTFQSTYGVQEAVVSPNGSELYVANQSGWLEIWNLTTGAQTQQVQLGNGPWAMTLSPDGAKLYIGILFDGEVAVVNRVTRAVERYINVEGVPRRIRFGPDNTTIVIANENGYITFIP